MAQQFEREVSAADVVDFFEKGMLDSLVLFFKEERSHYPLLGELLVDERIVVRLGTAALVESLAEEDPGGRPLAAAALLPLLTHDSPLVRGDAAYLLGMVAAAGELEALKALAGDSSGDVREAAAEAVEAVQKRSGLET